MNCIFTNKLGFLQDARFITAFWCTLHALSLLNWHRNTLCYVANWRTLGCVTSNFGHS